jgi:hypothetical protein
MKDYAAKKYMAAVHIDSGKTAMVKSFDTRIHQKDFNAWAFDGQLVYSRRGSNLVKVKGLAAPNEPVYFPFREENNILKEPKIQKDLSGQEFPAEARQINMEKINFQENSDYKGSKVEKFLEKATENDTPKNENDIFYLPNELGKFTQELQRFRLSVVLIGESGAGKSEMFSQLIGGFLNTGDRVAMFDLEHGGIRSKETKASLTRNVPNYEQLVSKGQFYIFGDAPDGLKTVREAAETGHFDTIAIDSWTELDELSVQFNNLRKDFPEINFICIFQMVDGKNIRGGNKPVFDAPIRIMCFKGENEFDFKENYAQMMKNRGNAIGGKYSMFDKKMITDINNSKSDLETDYNVQFTGENETFSQWSGETIDL